MRKTADRPSDLKLTVDLKGLAAMLSCGKDTARKIGEQAHARICIGRRVLYKVDKVMDYLSSVAE